MVDRKIGEKTEFVNNMTNFSVIYRITFERQTTIKVNKNDQIENDYLA